MISAQNMQKINTKTESIKFDRETDQNKIKSVSQTLTVTAIATVWKFLDNLNSTYQIRRSKEKIHFQIFLR